MENKYYTPKNEEFYKGFEFECLGTAMEKRQDGWVKLEFGNPYIHLLDYSEEALKSCFRVKYLDRSDIEELGWKHIGSGWYDLINVPGKLGYWCYVLLRIWEPNTFIKAYRSDPEKYPDGEQEYLFQGSIKNKSELRKLMAQLQINQ